MGKGSTEEERTATTCGARQRGMSRRIRSPNDHGRRQEGARGPNILTRQSGQSMRSPTPMSSVGAEIGGIVGEISSSQASVGKMGGRGWKCRGGHSRRCPSFAATVLIVNRGSRRTSRPGAVDRGAPRPRSPPAVAGPRASRGERVTRVWTASMRPPTVPVAGRVPAVAGDGVIWAIAVWVKIRMILSRCVAMISLCSNLTNHTIDAEVRTYDPFPGWQKNRRLRGRDRVPREGADSGRILVEPFGFSWIFMVYNPLSAKGLGQ